MERSCFVLVVDYCRDFIFGGFFNRIEIWEEEY